MGKLTDSQRDEAVELYRSGLTSREIGDLLGVSGVAICNLLRKRSIPLRHEHIQPKLGHKRELELCERYANGESASALAPAYGVSVSLISHILKRHSYVPRSHSEIRRTYSCNHSFFSDINNEENAYWLGFIAADGYVTRLKSRYSQQLIVSLASKDRGHLLRLRESLQSNHPIRDYDYSNRGKGKSKPYTSFSIRSQQLCDDLAQFGIVPAKTHTLRWPGLPVDLLRHFLRGYFDGDGYWNIDKRGKRQVAFRVTSNRGLLEDCQEYLMEACSLRSTKLSHQEHKGKVSCSTLIYSGNRQSRRIYDLLYKDATVYMPRKKASVAPLLF